METQAEELARLSYAFNVDPDVIKIAFDIGWRYGYSEGTDNARKIHTPGFREYAVQS